MPKEELIKNLLVCSGHLYDGDCKCCSLFRTSLSCQNILMKEAADVINDIFIIVGKLYNL